MGQPKRNGNLHELLGIVGVSSPQLERVTRKPALASAADDDQAIDPSKMTVREYAAACIDLGFKDYHQAVESTTYADPLFFIMRRMKRHPSLKNQGPDAAAGVFQRLWDDADSFRGACCECESITSCDDLVAYVLARWDGIRTLPDVTPWQYGFDAAIRGERIMIPRSVITDYVSKDRDPDAAAWESEPGAFAFPWDRVQPPSYGLFVVALWHAYQVLLFNPNKTAKPVLIIGTDAVSEILSRRIPVSGKTISAYRSRLEANKAITRLHGAAAGSKGAGMAYRYAVSLNDLVRVMYGLKHQIERVNAAMNAVKLD